MKQYTYFEDKADKGGKPGNGIRRKMLALMLILVMMAGVVGGCGNGNSGQTEEVSGTQGNAAEADGTSGDTDNSGNGQADAESSGSDKKAMGRYVESPVDLSEYTALSCGITELDDGTLLILDNKAGKLVSEDGGVTWRAEAIPGIPDLAAFTEENYIFTMKADRDGSIAVLYSPSLDEDGEFHTGLLLTGADGVSRELTELTASEEGYVRDIWFGPDGSLYASVIGSSSLYEVDTTSGEMHKYVALESTPDLVQFQGDYIIFLTSQDGISFYNKKEEKWLDDEVLTEFMRQNYMGEYYVNETYTVYMVPGEDNVIYVAGDGGVYRHVIGGSAMEQIIDGSLSTFSNPSVSIVNMITLADNEFMVLFSTGKLVRYTYDPNVPTVPEELVTVYSLQEEDTVRQAIAQYQAQNPQAFVRYEVGMSGSDAAAREDAIKKLNTELMAGKGPDVLILDDLPVNSYIEKGVLLDLSEHISGMTGEMQLMPNIVESFTQDGKIYRMPVSFTIPAMVGREDDLAQIHDLTSLTDTLERLREENPGKEIIGMFSEETAVKWLWPISAPVFVDETGNLDVQVISDYLENVKRIYTASEEGLMDTVQEYHGNKRELYRSGSDYFMEYYDNLGSCTMEFMIEESVFGAGDLKSFYAFQEVLSMNRLEGFEDVRIKPIDGHCSHVFVPHVMAGINASSGNRQEAEAFFDVLMGKEVQQLLWDGFVVNQTALESQLSPNWPVLANGGMNVDFGEVSSSVGGSFEDGREWHMNIYMPTKEEFQELYEIFCELDTPYIADPVIEDAIVEFGAQYVSSYLSLDETMQRIRSKVDLYMAE